MDPEENKKPRTLEQSELAPGTSQPVQQDNPDQDSEFVKIHIKLVTHLKDLDAQTEMDGVQVRAAKEQFPDYPNFEAGPSSKHLEAGDPIATSMKSPLDPEQPDSAGLVPATEQKMKEPASITVIVLNDPPGPVIYLTDTESPRVDIPSNDTKRGEIDLNRPYAEGEYEDVPNESTDAGNLPEVSDEQLIEDEEEQIKILREVLDGTDEKAKDELKSQLVGQSPPHDHVKKGSLYALCEESLKLLKQYFTKARGPSFWYLGTVQKIMKNAGKLNWLVDVLVEREIAQEFVTIWASQSETSDGYYKFAAEDRHELSRITATLLAGIGERKVYANQEARYSLLKTWLLLLCGDIGRRYAWSGIDLESIEYGLVCTIFSLPEPMQHEILSDWVYKHPNFGDKWPPLLAWYELWWSKPFK